MKVIGNLIIALLGGVVAIFLYRAFENNEQNEGKAM